MKNRPITARVKSGMFKTKEPLLNVGPAGVDGNNTTRTMPSPSKMKGYTMKSSPFKQAKTPKAIVEEAIQDQITNQGISLNKTITTTTPGTDGTPGSDGTPDVITKPTETFTGEKATGADAEKWAKQNEYCKGKPKGTPGCSGFHKYEGGALEKGTPKTDGTPGTKKQEDEAKTAIIEKVARKGEASGAYATRNNLRKAKVGARNVKKGQRKQDRADRRKDPTLSAKEQRRARKEQAAASIKKVADSELRNSQIQSEQGKSGFSEGKEIVLDDVKRQQGEVGPDRQRDMGTPVTPVEMNKPGFFKKKSPLKMNYFKK